MHPSREWIESQVPEIVKNGVTSNIDADDMDIDAFVQAYVNIVTGACISLGR